MTTIKPHLLKGTYKEIGTLNEFTNPEDFINAKVYEDYDYESLESSGIGSEHEIYITSYGKGAVTFYSTGNGSGLDRIFSNTFGTITVTGKHLPGIYSVSYSSRSRTNGGLYSASLVPYLHWNGNKSSIRKVDSPYGDIEGANSMNYYTTTNKKSMNYPTTPIEINYHYYGLFLHPNSDGIGSIYRYPIGSTNGSGSYKVETIEDIFTRMMKLVKECYGGSRLDPGLPGWTPLGVVGQPMVGALVDELNNSTETQNFIKSVRNGKFGDEVLNIRFGDGEEEEITTGEFKRDSIESVGDEVFTTYGSQNPLDSSDQSLNLVAGGKIIRSFNYEDISFTPFPAVMDWAREVGYMPYAIDHSEHPKNLYVPSDSEYTDALSYGILQTRQYYGYYYAEATKQLRDDKGLNEALGTIGKIFTFIAEAASIVIASPIFEAFRTFKALSTAAENTTNEMLDEFKEALAPQKLRFRHDLLTRNRTSDGMDLKYDDMPEYFKNNINSGSIGYSSILNAPKDVGLTFYENDEKKNAFNVGEIQSQDATTFLTKSDNVPLISGCTYYVLPGNLWRIDGEGKHPETSFTYY